MIDISVIITFYRERNLLEETIESVLNQSFKNFEIILVDNNADYETKKIANIYLNKFPSKIRIVSESTPGKSSARNKGILEGKGRYIALLDGDDLMRPDRLEKQFNEAISYPEFLLFSSSYSTFVVENEEKKFFYNQKDINLDYINLIFKSQNDPYLKDFYVPLPSTIFFERKKILELGGFDKFFDNVPGEDINFAVNMWRFGRFKHIDEYLVSYRAKRRDLKNKLSKTWMERTKRQIHFIKTIHQLYDKYPGNPMEKPLRVLKSMWMRETALHYFSCREGKIYGKNLLFKSLKYDPKSLECWKMIVKSYFPLKFYPRLFWFDKWNPLPPESDHEFFLKELN